MDCHDVRVLQALLRREGAIDPTERAALQQHLDACPDCAALCHSEQVVDAALGRSMRAVTVPAGLQTRLLTRIAATRPRRWPQLVAAAAAAVLLLIGAGTTWWALHRLTPMNMDIATAEIDSRYRQAPDDVERWYAEHGIEMATWRELDHQYLWTFDVVEFRGRRVAKLIFYKDADNRKPAALLEVLVLPTSQFNTADLPEINGSRINVDKPGSGYVYLTATDPPGGYGDFMLKPH